MEYLTNSVSKTITYKKQELLPQILSNLLCQNWIFFLPSVQLANNDTLKRDTDYLFQSCTILGCSVVLHKLHTLIIRTFYYL